MKEKLSQNIDKCFRIKSNIENREEFMQKDVTLTINLVFFFLPSSINHHTAYCNDGVLMQWCGKHSTEVVGVSGEFMYFYDRSLDPLFLFCITSYMKLKIMTYLRKLQMNHLNIFGNKKVYKQIFEVYNLYFNNPISFNI